MPVAILLSLVLLGACVKLLLASDSPMLAAGVFTFGKIMLVFFRDGSIPQLLTVAVIVSAIGFGYFWLLNRVEGSVAWWFVLLGGVILLV